LDEHAVCRRRRLGDQLRAAVVTKPALTRIVMLPHVVTRSVPHPFSHLPFAKAGRRQLPPDRVCAPATRGRKRIAARIAVAQRAARLTGQGVLRTRRPRTRHRATTRPAWLASRAPPPAPGRHRWTGWSNSAGRHASRDEAASEPGRTPPRGHSCWPSQPVAATSTHWTRGPSHQAPRGLPSGRAAKGLPACPPASPQRQRRAEP